MGVSMIYSFQLMYMLMMLSGAGNDLLSCVPADAYWTSQQMSDIKTDALITMISEAKPVKVDVPALIKDLGAGSAKVREAAREKLAQAGAVALPQLKEAAKSDDAEVAQAAKALVEKATPKGQEAKIRRLMAIRTLGERKAREAIPALKAIENSKVPFEADYARAALAAIDGKTYTPALPDAKQMAADLALLGDDIGAVVQIRALAEEPLRVAELLDLAAEAGEKSTSTDFNKFLLGTVNRIGNLRLTAFTIAISRDASEKEGYFIVIFRGQYDPQAATEALTNRGGPGGMEEKVMDGITTVQSSKRRQLALIMPSSDLAVLMVGLTAQKELPVSATVAAIKSGKGKFAENKAMAALLKDVDTASPAWAACLVSESYKKAPLLEGLETIVASAQVKPGTVEVSCTAKGNDQAKVDKAVKDFNQGLQDAQKSLDKWGKYFEQLKPTIDFVQGVKVAQDKTVVTVKTSCSGAWHDTLILPFRAMLAPGAYHHKGGDEADRQERETAARAKAATMP